MAKKIIGLVIIVALIIGAIGTYLFTQKQPEKPENHSYSMVKHIEKVNEQVFLNVGIQDVESQTNNLKIPWTKIGIPLTTKKSLIVLNYNAKLGIKKSVQIKTIGDKSYQISIPKYEVIGIDLDEKEPYQIYDKSGALLSYSTKDVDTGEVVAQVLSNKRQQKYLKQYKEQMDESAQKYYKDLFDAVDSDVKLEFVFAK